MNRALFSSTSTASMGEYGATLRHHTTPQNVFGPGSHVSQYNSVHVSRIMIVGVPGKEESSLLVICNFLANPIIIKDVNLLLDRST